MRSLQNFSAFFFIIAVTLLGIISILGVWDIVGNDIILKSFQTLGLLGLVAAIIIGAGNYMEGGASVSSVPFVPNPAFKSIRVSTLVILITSGSVLALLGVLAIWEVISDKDILYKSLGTLGIIAFVSFIIVLTCLDREKSPMLNSPTKKYSTGGIIVLCIVGYMLLSTLLGSLRY